MTEPLIIETICPDNDGTARADLAKWTVGLTSDDKKSLRESAPKVMRGDDEVIAHVIGRAPGLVALLLEGADGVLLLSETHFDLAWGDA